MKKTLLFLLCSCLICTASFPFDFGMSGLFGAKGPRPLESISTYGNIFEYPHSSWYDIGCESCHWVNNPSLPPEWATFVPQDNDDTLHNNLCRNCHNDIVAPSVLTHSSLNTSNKFGSWSLECKVCHDPHVQYQKYAYGNESFRYQGIVTSVSGVDNSLRCAGAGWTDNAFLGLPVYPNVVQWPYRSSKILRNSSDTLYTDGLDITRVAAGSTFAILRGKLVKDSVPTPSSGNKGVKFFQDNGAHSFSDGDGVYDGICEVCHTGTDHYRNNNSSDHSHKQDRKCTQCHVHKKGFRKGGGGAHPAHDDLLSCDSGALGCHGANDPPALADNQLLAATSKCNNCHTATGAAVAKTYWNAYGTSGSWRSTLGEVSFCVSCHNPTPGRTQMDGGGDAAPDVYGNNSTYGYAVTGHGKPAGTYPRLSWQSTSATGNPAAGRACSACHDLATTHFNNPGNRLRAGFGNDNTNSNCRQCHDPGTAATGSPPWYTTYSEYQASAHAALKCTDCHDVHGKSGAYAGMTTAGKQALCLQAGCHAGMSGHALGVSFGRGGQSYSLECVSCHNVHIVTGRISAADTTKTPLSRIDNNILTWGGAAGQKMSDYVGSGTYRTPNGDMLAGTQLPDYPTFCLQCHGQNMSPSIHGTINWNDLHGRGSANVPNGGGTCPNWYACGLAFGWDADDCTGGDNVCWPVINRGYGDELFSRLPYSHDVRVGGGNFVLSCNDCHTTHTVVNGAWKVRGSINGGGITGEWKSICNACHYYYSDWHAQMSCGNANSCHDANPNSRFGYPSESIHGMSSMSGDGSTRAVDNTLVLDLRFENNLNDSGSFRLHSKWFSDPTNYPSIVAGSFTGGKSGQAVSLGGNSIVQVGTTNANWSTDDGYHGTWKMTEMKYNTTMQAWVYPTDNNATEMSLFTKHVGISSGGYQFLLKKVGPSLRAVFNMQADSNAGAQGGMAGTRGAYSVLAIPLNKWTHVAAAFDRNGPDRNPADPSVGRIRIYVNGIDVTASDASGIYMQPGPGETSIFAYSENSPWNQGICYNGVWCASEFAVGGFPWQNRFTGRIDEAKVWNVTKDNVYFSAFDIQAGPYISTVSGAPGSNQLMVILSEGVYTNNNMTGALTAADFVLTDTDNGRSITGVTHTAGSATAALSLSSALDSSNDLGVDTLRAASTAAIFDRNGLAAGTDNVTISGDLPCPASPVAIELNESSGSAYVHDTQGMLVGTVNNAASSIPGDGSFHGNGSSANYIDFNYNLSCLLASTAMTLETRLKPQGLAGVTGNYVGRAFERNTGNANYQLTVWRQIGNANFPGYTAPTGVASIALWVSPVDAHGGSGWKPVLTNYTQCPIVSDHWYNVRAIWDTSKPGGTPGQFFVPADIWVEDQGSNGAYNDNQWAGWRNCTNSSQSYQVDASKLWTGDTINTATGMFTIGSSVTHGNLFNGLIDRITWSDTVGTPPGAPVRATDMDLILRAPSP